MSNPNGIGGWPKGQSGNPRGNVANPEVKKFRDSVANYVEKKGVAPTFLYDKYIVMALSNPSVMMDVMDRMLPKLIAGQFDITNDNKYDERIYNLGKLIADRVSAGIQKPETG